MYVFYFGCIKCVCITCLAVLSRSVWLYGSMQVLLRTLGGSEGNAYFANVVRVGGGPRGKMLILLMQKIKILIRLKMAFKSVKYHLTLWSKAIYEKISQIHP